MMARWYPAPTPPGVAEAFALLASGEDVAMLVRVDGTGADRFPLGERECPTPTFLRRHWRRYGEPGRLRIEQVIRRADAADNRAHLCRIWVER